MTAQPPTPPFDRATVRALYDRPLFSLIDEARAIHRAHHVDQEVQLCTLLSVKTGGCQEDCGYCSQSSHHNTDVGPEKMLDVEQVLAAARRAKDSGSTRFCMGAAWREVKDGPAFDRVLAMIRGVKGMGLEACVTLGMLTDTQAAQLKEAGLDAYNHNVDTSREHYRSIVTTRTYDDRLKTLERVRGAALADRLSVPVLWPLAVGSEWAARAFGVEPMVTRDHLRMAKKKMFFSSGKAVAELGYRYRSAREAIADAVAWFRGSAG